VDLRVGISTVVMRDNLDELPALAELAIDLGVDWVKVEETFPINGFARLRMVAPSDPRLKEAVAAARARLAAADVVLVDHLAPPVGCACAALGDPHLAAFRKADDFANRATFSPCRMAWEQACVDPDGTVHLVDYYAPPVGNLNDTTFLDLWNSPSALAERARQLSATPRTIRLACGRGPT
jgi:MoaA/NifB/PqqE/SkfB family radical SAM enzyme